MLYINPHYDQFIHHLLLPVHMSTSFLRLNLNSTARIILHLMKSMCKHLCTWKHQTQINALNVAISKIVKEVRIQGNWMTMCDISWHINYNLALIFTVMTSSSFWVEPTKTYLLFKQITNMTYFCISCLFLLLFYYIKRTTDIINKVNNLSLLKDLQSICHVLHDRNATLLCRTIELPHCGSRALS